MPILLKDIWPIKNYDDYKIHFARYNQNSQPLDVWVRSREEWQTWHEYRPGRNAFNRQYIFTLMQFYHEQDSWLFGGVYEVLERRSDRYGVALTHLGKDFIGRLKIHSTYKSRTTRTNLESHYDYFEVKEILREEYQGRTFSGYDEIDLSFDELDSIFVNERLDWKTALANNKGIYLITDTHSGKIYVGAAYGKDGIWSRWQQYICDGHGGNVALRNIANKEGIAYCRSNFRFSLLEHRTFNTPDNVVLKRETFWKNILQSRGIIGNNKN